LFQLRDQLVVSWGSSGIALSLLMLIAGVSLRHIGGLVLIGIMGMMILFATAKRAETWKNRLKDYLVGLPR
jgi:cell division protein FtsW (lipid II flippase)